jgi:hypothetical protein
MEISIDDLEQIAAILFAHLKSTGHAKVTIDHDYYWQVPADARFDLTAEPTELDVGQLTDDLAELLRIQRKELDPIGYSLTRLASILDAIGQQVVG